MEILTDEFDRALGRINLSDEKVTRAKAAHEEVRALLETDEVLKRYEVDTILIGSYARAVAIQPGHDVDILVKLRDYDEDPESLYQAVRNPLLAEYGDRLDDTGAHALTISFGDEFSIDAVGATNSTTSKHWVLPALDAFGDRTLWEETDPLRLSELSAKRNEDPCVGTQGAYKPVVKLVRQIRAYHLGSARPKGLYLEMLTYWAFESGVTGSSFAEFLASALDLIAASLESGVVVHDPALEQPFTPAPTVDELATAADVFRAQAIAAAKALTLDRCRAAVVWRGILGRNANGWVFPIPDGCDEHGGSIKKVEAVAAVGSNEARGFAAA